MINESSLWPVSSYLLAQRGGASETGGTGAPGEGGNGEGAPPGGGGGDMLQFLFLMMLAMLVFMIVMSVTQGRKQKRQRAELLGSLKKQDRVQTIGGVIGTIAEVHDDEVVLRVDDSSNTRIRFSKSAVQQVLKSGQGSGASVEPALNDPKQPNPTGA